MNPSSPRSIDDYLHALRSALAGADPALIQDALYDAEDHLRAEAAANPGKSEAELLEHDRADVRRAGRSGGGLSRHRSEGQGGAAAAGLQRVQSSHLLSRFFSVYADPRAYVSLFFMFLSLVTGCVYFTFAVTGLSLSLGLAILIIGLPVFLGFIGITRVISLGEGRLLEAVSGERMPRRPVHPGAPDGLVARILEMLKDVRTWTTLLYMLVMLPLGTVYFVTAVTGFAVGVSFLLVPVAGIAQRLGWWVRHVGDHHAPQGAVREGGRVAEFGLVFLERVSLHGVFGTEAHVQIANHRGEQLLIHVAVTHDLAAGHHAAIGGHDAGVGFDKFCEPFERADAAAQPGAVPVVEQRPFLRGHDAAGDQQIHLRKMDVEIPVGVRRGHVAVVDLLAGELHRAVTARGLSRSGSFGQRGPAAFERHRVDGVAQVHPRLLVREDDAAAATDRFVGAGLLGMPVRVDQRVDATGARRGS